MKLGSTGRLVLLVSTLAAAVATAGCLSGVDFPGDGGNDGGDASSRAPATPTDVGTSDGGDDETNGAGGGNGTATDAPNGTEETRRGSPSLPGNVTMEGAEVLERTNRSVAFSWNGTVAPTERRTQGRTVTDLHVPPDRWLKVEATVTWTDPTVHLAPELRHEAIEWCNSLGNDPERTAALVTDTTESTCTVRPDPRNGWQTWDAGAGFVSSPGPQVRQVPFEIELTVTAMAGPWGDIEQAPAPDDWPPLAEASIRPGVKVGHEGCTANFLLRSPDNASLYLGAANHCFDAHGEGTMLTVAGLPDAGRIAYCSWTHTDLAEANGTCPAFEGAAGSPNNDFMLLELRPDLRPLVHPAMEHWGGPTGLVHNASVGDRVLVHGNSSFRDAGQAELRHPGKPSRGHVRDASRWLTDVRLAPPAIPGDSGSPALAGDGRALGIVKALSCPDDGHTNALTNLAPALEVLHEETDLEVELVTWPMLREPTVSAIPVDAGAPASLCGGGEAASG